MAISWELNRESMRNMEPSEEPKHVVAAVLGTTCKYT
jgi:hypothetical protein